MTRTVMTLLTNFGDAALLLPLSLLLVLVLAYRHSLKAAGAWLLALGFCLGGMAALKVMGFTCGRHLFGTSLVSPSGHAAFSAAFYGSLGVLAYRQFSDWRRLAVPAVLCAIIAAVVLTRVLLGNHSRTEAALGLVMGTISVAVFAWRFLALKPAPLRLRAEAFAFALLLFVLHGQQLHAEQIFKNLAMRIREHTEVCVPAAELSPPAPVVRQHG